MGKATLAEKTRAQENVDRLNEAMATGTHPLMAGAEIIERTITEGKPLTALIKIHGVFRVVVANAYVNRATRPQIGVMMQDHEDLEDAKALYDDVVAYNGFLAFGDVFRLSVGSGMRYVKTIV